MFFKARIRQVLRPKIFSKLFILAEIYISRIVIERKSL